MIRKKQSKRLQYDGCIGALLLGEGEPMTTLRTEIAELIRLSLPWEAPDVTYEVLDSVKEEGYTRQLISYLFDGDKVSAFLLLPDKLGNNPAIFHGCVGNRKKGHQAV